MMIRCNRTIWYGIHTNVCELITTWRRNGGFKVKGMHTHLEEGSAKLGKAQATDLRRSFLQFYLMDQDKISAGACSHSHLTAPSCEVTRQRQKFNQKNIPKCKKNTPNFVKNHKSTCMIIARTFSIEKALGAHPSFQTSSHLDSVTEVTQSHQQKARLA